MKIQKLQAQNIIKDEYIKTYESFVKILSEEFAWCSNCMSSCFEVSSKSRLLQSRSTTGDQSEISSRVNGSSIEIQGNKAHSTQSNTGNSTTGPLKIDMKCYKECKLKYFKFLEKLGIKLKESLAKIEIKEKKLMKDASKIGPIDSE